MLQLLSLAITVTEDMKNNFQSVICHLKPKYRGMQCSYIFPVLGTSSLSFAAFLRFLSYHCAFCVLEWVLGQRWASCGCLARLSCNGSLCLLCVGACLLPCPTVLGR